MAPNTSSAPTGVLFEGDSTHTDTMAGARHPELSEDVAEACAKVSFRLCTLALEKKSWIIVELFFLYKNRTKLCEVMFSKSFSHVIQYILVLTLQREVIDFFLYILFLSSCYVELLNTVISTKVVIRYHDYCNSKVLYNYIFYIYIADCKFRFSLTGNTRERLPYSSCMEKRHPVCLPSPCCSVRGLSHIHLCQISHDDIW